MNAAVTNTATKIASSFKMSEEDLYREALVSFLLQQKRQVLQHRLDILARYGSDTLASLETKISQGEVSEHPAWEDLIVAENLGDRLEELDAYLDDLHGPAENRPE